MQCNLVFHKRYLLYHRVANLPTIIENISYSTMGVCLHEVDSHIVNNVNAALELDLSKYVKHKYRLNTRKK